MICPHCKTECKNFGFFNCRCQRYRCNSCGKTFSDIPYRPLGLSLIHICRALAREN